MKIETKDMYNIIQGLENLKLDLDSIIENYTNQNLIVDLSELDMTSINFNLFKDIYQRFKKNKKTLVLVLNDTFDFNQLPQYIIATPTLQEAHDLIEMDEIERDLGF